MRIRLCDNQRVFALFVLSIGMFFFLISFPVLLLSGLWIYAIQDSVVTPILFAFIVVSDLVILIIIAIQYCYYYPDVMVIDEKGGRIYRDNKEIIHIFRIESLSIEAKNYEMSPLIVLGKLVGLIDCQMLLGTVIINFETDTGKKVEYIALLSRGKTKRFLSYVEHCRNKRFDKAKELVILEHLSIISVILSILSIPAGMVTVFIVGEAHLYGMAGIAMKSWIFLLFLFFPVLTFVFVIISIIKKHPFYSNLIFSIYSIFILCHMAFVNFKINTSTTDVYFKHMSSIANVYIPDQLEAKSYDFSTYEVLSHAIILNHNQENDLVDTFDDYRWKNKIDDEIRNILPEPILREADTFDYHCCYTEKYDRFNYASDLSDGLYLLSYQASTHRLMLYVAAT